LLGYRLGEMVLVAVQERRERQRQPKRN
jgi:hypothetical protein